MPYDRGERVVFDAASWSFGIHVNHDDLSVSQQVGPWIHDHRGRSTLASVGVLVDLSLSFGAAHTGMAAVLASLNVSIAAELPDSALVIGRFDHGDYDATTQTALLASHLVDADGRVLMRTQARAAVVDRPLTPPQQAISTASDLRTEIAPAEVDSLGAYADWIGLQLTSACAESTTGTWTALPWTANAVGGVQGGVMLGLMSTATELAADAMAEPDQAPRLAELNVDFFRPPTPELGLLTFCTTTVRKSRRFANIDVALRDSLGRIISQSRGTVLFPSP